MIQDFAPHVFENQFRPDEKPAPDSVVCVFDDERKIFVRKGRSEDLLPRMRETEEADGGPASEYIFLFRMDGTDYFLAEGGVKLPEEFEAVSLRTFRSLVHAANDQVFPAWTAYQLSNWYRDNRYCGTCGSLTVLSKRERAVKCPSCGRTIYPRIIPAVIIGVTNGDEMILTRYNRPGAYHALVAGFVEIGETFEDTVHREVMEEVGLKVKNIRYYKSQPWGIVDDLLAGFYCDVDGDPSIRVDGVELKEAKWYKRDEIDSQPDNLSLTNEMMQVFKAGREPKGENNK